MLEVALVDDRFVAVRPFIGPADLFLSHADRESFLGRGSNNGNPDCESTMQLLFNFDRGQTDFNLPSKRMWVDYT